MPFVLETIFMNIPILCAQDAYLELHPQSKIPVAANWPEQGKSLEEVLSKKGNTHNLIEELPIADTISIKRHPVAPLRSFWRMALNQT
jgi:hypothetical protein